MNIRYSGEMGRTTTMTLISFIFVKYQIASYKLRTSSFTSYELYIGLTQRQVLWTIGLAAEHRVMLEFLRYIAELEGMHVVRP